MAFETVKANLEKNGFTVSVFATKEEAAAYLNEKIDKVTVWDNGQSADGKNATAGFISGMMKSVPPLEEVFSMAGMQLPEILGKKAEPELTAAE